MKLLVVNEFGNGIVVTAQAIPSLGVSVDVFNVMPRPRVTGVLMWPSTKTLEALNVKGFEIEAIVTCA
jgi:hypothetical protein